MITSPDDSHDDDFFIVVKKAQKLKENFSCISHISKATPDHQKQTMRFFAVYFVQKKRDKVYGPPFRHRAQPP